MRTAHAGGGFNRSAFSPPQESPSSGVLVSCFLVLLLNELLVFLFLFLFLFVLAWVYNHSRTRPWAAFYWLLLVLVRGLYFEITEYAHFLLYDHVAFARIILVLFLCYVVRWGWGGREGGVSAGVSRLDEPAYHHGSRASQETRDLPRRQAEGAG